MAFGAFQGVLSFSERNSENSLAVRAFNVAMSFSVFKSAVLKLEPVSNFAEERRYFTQERSGTFAKVKKYFIFLCTLRNIF